MPVLKMSCAMLESLTVGWDADHCKQIAHPHKRMFASVWLTTLLVAQLLTVPLWTLVANGNAWPSPGSL